MVWLEPALTKDASACVAVVGMLFLPTFVISLIGLAYPAYCSAKALHEKDIETATQWLAYWMIYTAFTMVEGLLGVVLYFVPLYAELKLCFILWLQLPHFNGATWLYQVYLDKLINEATQSAVMEKVSALVGQIKSNGLSAEQIRDVTEWVQGKVRQFQKVPAPAEAGEQEKNKESDKVD